MRIRDQRAYDEPGIDLVPLIDVILVLIIFFVVTTTFDARSVLKLELPRADGQPAQQNDQPLSVLEAMAWMRPTIATRAGGLPELVVDGETGRLVPKGRARALAAAMKEYLVAPEKAHAAGLRARERREREFPFDRMVRDHVGLYEAEARG